VAPQAMHRAVRETELHTAWMSAAESVPDCVARSSQPKVGVLLATAHPRPTPFAHPVRHSADAFAEQERVARAIGHSRKRGPGAVVKESFVQCPFGPGSWAVHAVD